MAGTEGAVELEVVRIVQERSTKTEQNSLETKSRNRLIETHSLSYYNSANLCLSVCLSVCLKFDFRENRSPGELQTRPMCCSEPDDVPFIFKFVRKWSNYKIKRLRVVFAMPSPPMLLLVIPPMVAHSIALWVADTGVA